MEHMTRFILVSLLMTGILRCPSPGQPVGTSAATSGPSRPLGVEGQPYSATRTTTYVQRLADGTTVTHQRVSKEARDSQGRTRQESIPSAGANFTHVAVMDPVARTWTIWTSQSKQAIVLRVGAPREEEDGAGEHDLHNLPKDFNVHQDMLGGRQIGNIYAEGIRITGAPASRTSAGQRVLITIETWRSPELKIVVLETTDDPRFGVITEEITNLKRSEPDPSLFKLAAGYTSLDKWRDQPQ